MSIQIFNYRFTSLIIVYGILLDFLDGYIEYELYYFSKIPLFLNSKYIWFQGFQKRDGPQLHRMLATHYLLTETRLRGGNDFDQKHGDLNHHK
jgi:hypothetical protein